MGFALSVHRVNDMRVVRQSPANTAQGYPDADYCRHNVKKTFVIVILSVRFICSVRGIQGIADRRKTKKIQQPIRRWSAAV